MVFSLPLLHPSDDGGHGGGCAIAIAIVGLGALPVVRCNDDRWEKDRVLIDGGAASRNQSSPNCSAAGFEPPDQTTKMAEA
jgi:hypothetical protein